MLARKVRLNKLHINQQAVIDQRQRFNVLSCGRRWGKSALAINLLAETAIAGEFAAYFAPTYKLMNEIFRQLLATLEPITKHKDETEKRIELITGGLVDFWSLHKDGAGRGRKYHRAIVDEAAFTQRLQTAWNEQIRPTLTDFKGDGWILSTPRGKNDFFRFFMRGKQQDPGWQAFQMSTYTNPFIDASEVDDARRDLPELAFSQEYLAEFNDNVANPFGAAYIAQCTYPLSPLPAVCYGVDLAKSHDFTVIIGIDKNGSVCHFDRFQKDWRSTAQAILSLPTNAPINIDSTGVGDPIGEDIARQRANVHLFKFTQTSKQQIMEGLAMAIQKRLITFPEGVITDELNNFEYVFTRTGVRYSAPAGLHDDAVCALALAWDGKTKFKTMGTYAFG